MTSQSTEAKVSATQKSFEFVLLTPEREVFKDKVIFGILPGALGELGILLGHIPLVTSLTWGEVRVRLLSGQVAAFAVTGGFAQIEHSSLTVLADAAERSDEIDVERAKKAQMRALERLEKKQENIDYVRARAALARAELRLKIARR